jgi:hypothetical protein
MELARTKSELAGIKAAVRISAGDLVMGAQDERGMVTELAMLCHSLKTSQINGKYDLFFLRIYTYI